MIFGDISLFRIYTRLGFLCQRKRKWNRYYSLTDAAEWFRRSVSCLPSVSDKKAAMTVLKPFCNTLLEMESFDEAWDVCSRMYAVDPRDQQVYVLLLEAHRLRRIKDEGLAYGEPCDEKRLNEASEAEIQSSFETLYKTLTEEQRFYSDAFGCAEKYKTPAMGKSAYLLLYCIANNLAIPAKLHRSWAIDRNRRAALIKQLGLQE